MTTSFPTAGCPSPTVLKGVHTYSPLSDSWAESSTRVWPVCRRTDDPSLVQSNFAAGSPSSNGILVSSPILCTQYFLYIFKNCVLFLSSWITNFLLHKDGWVDLKKIVIQLCNTYGNYERDWPNLFTPYLRNFFYTSFHVKYCVFVHFCHLNRAADCIRCKR